MYLSIEVEVGEVRGGAQLVEVVHSVDHSTPHRDEAVHARVVRDLQRHAAGQQLSARRLRAVVVQRLKCSIT